MLIHRGCKYRIYPTPEQEARLVRWQDTLRFLWNLGLEQWHLWMNGVVPKKWRGERHFLKADGVTDEQANAEPLDLKFFHSRREGHKYPSAMTQNKQLTDLRKEHDWIRDVPRDVCEALFFDLEAAWKRCFRGQEGAPHWKRRGDSVLLSEEHGRLIELGKYSILFPKIGVLRAVIHRRMKGKQCLCSLFKEGDQWFAGIVYELEVPDPLPSAKPAVGIDRGVVNLLADSDGRLVENPRFLEKMSARIARVQRVVDRRKKGSKNREKAKVRVSRLHRTVQRQRRHVLHVESKRYAKSHGIIVLEKLNTTGMSASASGTPEEPGTNVAAKSGLNRSILAAGWGIFSKMLKYKVVPEGGQVREVPAAYTSQTCSRCGCVDAASRVSQAVFRCTGCGHEEHADTNAAKVIRSRGTHGVAACGGSPIAGPVKQESRPVRTRRLNQAG